MDLNELDVPEADKQRFREVYSGLTDMEDVTDVDFEQDGDTVLLRAEYTGTADDYQLRLLRSEKPALDVYSEYEEHGIEPPEDSPTVGVKIGDERVYFENEYQVSD